LFISLILPIAGTYLWLQHQKAVVRKDVKRKIIAGLSKEELVLLKFSLKETLPALKWKHSKEFEYQHQMYDVVAYEFSGDSVKYWCWADNHETKLNKQLADLMNNTLGKDQQRQNNQKRLRNFFKSLYFSSTENLNNCGSEANQTIFRYAFFYTQIRIIPPTPPPEIA